MSRRNQWAKGKKFWQDVVGKYKQPNEIAKVLSCSSRTASWYISKYSLHQGRKKMDLSLQEIRDVFMKCGSTIGTARNMGLSSIFPILRTLKENNLTQDDLRQERAEYLAKRRIKEEAITYVMRI